MLAALIALIVAAPLARAAPAGGEAAPAGHDDAAERSNAPPKDAAPANGTPREHGSHDATGGHGVAPGDSGKNAPHVGGRSIGPRPSEGAKDGAANTPAIGARPLPIPRVTSRPIKELLPKPFTFPKPHVRHAPAFAIAAPARNAIGVPLDRALVARPAAVTPGISAHVKGTSSGPAGGTAMHQIVVPPIPSGPPNIGLNGTAISRIGTGPATVGGAARFTTGINGTSIRPKHGN